MPDARSARPTPRDAFATRAVHAGRRARRGDRRRLAADLPDLDLRPGRRRPAARRLRVRPQPEPDPRAARARGGGPRGRPPRDRVRERVGDDRGHRAARRRRATRSSSATTSTAARTATSSACTGPAGGAAARYVDLASGAGRPVGGPDRADAPRLVRDAVEPAAQGHRHRGVGRDHPRPRGAGGPGAAAGRRRQHVRVARPPAAARARRRHRVPLGHQVPRRALGHDPRDRGHRRRRRRRAAAVPAERDGRRARAVRLLPRPARPPDPRPADGAPLRQRDWPSPGSSPAATTWRGSATRGSPTVATPIPGTRRPRARCGSATSRRSAAWCRSRLAAGGASGRSGGRAGGRRLRVDPAVHPRRVAGQRRVADRGAGGDDAPLGRRSRALAVDPALVRLSVGIEDADDLIADLRAGARPRPRTSSSASGSGADPSMPARAASSAASVRLDTPSLVRMWVTWTEAVLVLMNSASPISRLVRPSATRRQAPRARAPTGPSGSGGAALASRTAPSGDGAVGVEGDPGGAGQALERLAHRRRAHRVDVRERGADRESRRQRWSPRRNLASASPWRAVAASGR